ncbi:MAG: hypothetical protein HY695_28580 [Deltaproteobacteria bacterium]|nr:hypothetical protein [Deltaproteobacteria bacterium]
MGYGPRNAKHKYKLTASAMDANGKNIGRYDVEDAVHAALGPLANARLGWLEQSTFSEMLENMVRNVYQKMLDDKLLNYR